MNFNMSDVSTTKMTSKGQVVIPEEIREHMHLEAGVKFIVMATDDSIIFKKINPIPKKEIRSLLNASHTIAKEYGVTERDIEQAINGVRKSRIKQPLYSKSDDIMLSQTMRKVATMSKSKSTTSSKAAKDKVADSKTNGKGKRSKK